MSDSLNKYNFHDFYYPASESLKALIDSEVVGEFVTKEFSEFDRSIQSKLILSISIKMLGGMDESELLKILSELQINNASDSEKIESFIKLTLDEGVGSEENNIEAEINEVEESLQKLNPIRTMANDSRQVGYSSNEETTYTSAQPSLRDEIK